MIARASLRTCTQRESPDHIFGSLFLDFSDYGAVKTFGCGLFYLLLSSLCLPKILWLTCHQWSAFFIVIFMFINWIYSLFIDDIGLHSKSLLLKVLLKPLFRMSISVWIFFEQKIIRRATETILKNYYLPKLQWSWFELDYYYQRTYMCLKRWQLIFPEIFTLQITDIVDPHRIKKQMNYQSSPG